MGKRNHKRKMERARRKRYRVQRGRRMAGRMGGTMKELKLILVVLLICLPIWGVYRYVENLSPTWEATAQAQAVIDLEAAKHNAQVDIQAYQQRAQLLTGLLHGVGTGVVLLVFGFGAVYAWRVVDQRRESWARAVDGTFALQTFKGSNGQVWQVDSNKSIYGAFGFDRNTGQLVTDASMTTPTMQLTYAQDVQRTRTMAAMSGEGGIHNSAQAKFAAGFHDRPRQLDYTVADEPKPVQLAVNWQPLTLVDAFNRSTPASWLLGQNATGACEFSIMDAQHVGILGAQGTGKTNSTGILMMLYALKSNFHVVALDGKGGVDWMRYKSHIEVYPTDYAVIGDQVNELYHKYQGRLKDLGRAGASDIYELAQVSHQVKPVMVFLEEFGSTMDTLKAESSKQHAATELQIKEIFRKGRSTGIHLVLIDQLMHGWPGVMKANTKGLIAYKIGGQQGAAFNAYKLHELADKGQFWNNGGVYDAWFTKPEAERLLQNLRPSEMGLLTDVQYTALDATDDTGSVPRGEAIPQIDRPLHDTSINTGHENTPVADTGIAPDPGLDTSIKKPLLTGKPVSAKDQNTVRNIHAMTGSINETCRLVWGAKTPSRAQWVKAVLQGGAVPQ